MPSRAPPPKPSPQTGFKTHINRRFASRLPSRGLLRRNHPMAPHAEEWAPSTASEAVIAAANRISWLRQRMAGIAPFASPNCFLLPWVACRSAGFFAIRWAPRRLRDPDAVFSEKTETIPSLTLSSLCIHFPKRTCSQRNALPPAAAFLCSNCGSNLGDERVSWRVYAQRITSLAGFSLTSRL